MFVLAIAFFFFCTVNGYIRDRIVHLMIADALQYSYI